jgi:hypothetical protein
MHETHHTAFLAFTRTEHPHWHANSIRVFHCSDDGGWRYSCYTCRGITCPSRSYYPSTTSLTLEEIEHHVCAVRLGCSTSLLVVDMSSALMVSALLLPLKTPFDWFVRVRKRSNLRALPLVDTTGAMTSICVPGMKQLGLLPHRAVALWITDTSQECKCSLRAPSQLKSFTERWRVRPRSRVDRHPSH